MKFRLKLGIAILFVGLALMGVNAQAAQAQTAVQLSATDRANLQAVLDVTKATLDAVQLQINSSAVQNPAVTLAYLDGVRTYLFNMQGFLGGSSVSTTQTSQTPPVQVATQPSPEPDVLGETDAEEGAMVSEEGAMESEMQEEDQGAAAETTGATSRWAFWVILVAAIALAIVLAMPRRKEMRPQPQPQPKPQPLQSNQPAEENRQQQQQQQKDQSA